MLDGGGALDQWSCALFDCRAAGRTQLGGGGEPKAEGRGRERLRAAASGGGARRPGGGAQRELQTRRGPHSDPGSYAQPPDSPPR